MKRGYYDTAVQNIRSNFNQLFNEKNEMLGRPPFGSRIAGMTGQFTLAFDLPISEFHEQLAIIEQQPGWFGPRPESPKELLARLGYIGSGFRRFQKMLIDDDWIPSKRLSPLMPLFEILTELRPAIHALYVPPTDFTIQLP